MYRSLLLFLFIYVSAGMAQVLSDFDTDSLDNWRSEGDGKYYLEAETGNPGSCMRIDDDATGDLNIAIAPFKFVGDWSVSDTTDSVFADVFVHLISGSALTNRWIFRITGPGGQAIAPIPAPARETWVHIAIAMDSSQWTMVSGTWHELLAYVSHVEVPAEFINGDEFVRLDNIGMSFTPSVVPLKAPVSSEFDHGSYQGWVFENTGGISLVASGGNPGGFCQISDAAGISYGIAPPGYLGDWSQLNNAAALQLDIRITGISGSLLPGNYLWRISGPGGAAIAPADSSILNAFNKWASFSVMISESAWQMESGSWSDLLTQVTELRLICEFINGGETVSLDNIRIANSPPQADYSVSRTYLFPGDQVQFTDHSTYVPDSWQWTFGDGGSSSVQDPVYVYETPGIYDVQLIAGNLFGESTMLKEELIRVHAAVDSVLFADDFADNTLHPAWQFRNGSWVERAGQIEQTSNYFGTGYINGCYALVGSKYWQNYRLSADLRSTDNDKIGLVFNYQDAQNFYLFTWQQEGNLRALKKFVAGVETNLFSDDSTYVTGQWYHVEITVDKGNIRASVDSSEIFSVTDSSFLTGKAGLYCHGNQSSFWDNFQVIALEEPVDALEPTNFLPVSGSYDLQQNYPNPFNPVTRISYNLAERQYVRLEVYNLLGERVAVLVNGEQAAGIHQAVFYGSNLTSGLYFYKIRAGEYTASRRMIILK